MKKKWIANLIMCAIIAVIVTAGVLTVGNIRGWFDKADETVAVLTDIRGVIRLERDGVSYPAEGNTVLRTADVITAESGATAVLRMGNDYITIGSNAKLTVSDPAADRFQAEVTTGEVFANTERAITLTFDSQQIVITNATAALSVRSGAQTVSVFRGAVADAAAGQAIEYVDGKTTVSPMQLESLNQFTIDQIRIANETAALCYSNEDLDALADKRQQALQDIINSITPTESEQTEPTGQSENNTDQNPVTGPTASSGEGTDEPKPTEPSAPTTGQPTDSTPTEPSKPDTTEPTESKPTEPTEAKPTDPPADQPAGSCYITIRCDTILRNMDALTPGKAEFLPADGVILSVVEVPFYEGETVFEVLKRVCDIADIQLEYSWTPMYNSYYIEGINNLYEFDCGDESGWMYKVNEWFPNYGCSSYALGEGDVIVWTYTCQGYGTDVGAPEWTE